MSKTKFFISSTCFNLDQIREDIRNSLEGIGHDVVLSENSSFPVVPKLETNADVFVLVIGGRRGTLDKEINKPITNLDYETAILHKIDSFILVNNAILNLMPLWERNHSMDFSSHVDSVEVFKFIKRIQSDNNWIISYERVSDIIEILKVQISCFLKHLLDKKRQGRLIPINEFINETEIAQKIVSEKPDYWEFLLTVELLNSKFIIIKRKFDHLQRGLIHRKSQKVTGKKFLSIVSTKCNDLVSLMNLLKIACTEEISLSWGKPGVSGVATEIKRAVDIIISGSELLLEWEADLLSITPPAEFLGIKNKMRGWASQIFNQLFIIPESIQEIIGVPKPEGQHTITLVFESPANVEELTEEIRCLSENRES